MTHVDSSPGAAWSGVGPGASAAGAGASSTTTAGAAADDDDDSRFFFDLCLRLRFESADASSFEFSPLPRLGVASRASISLRPIKRWPRAPQACRGSRQSRVLAPCQFEQPAFSWRGRPIASSPGALRDPSHVSPMTTIRFAAPTIYRSSV